MAKDPAFLFYAADFMIGTALMTFEQRGKYISLLCYQHQLGHLRNEDLLAVCGGEDVLIFSKFKKDKKGLYYNERLEEEMVRRSNYTASRRNNAKAHGKHMPKHMETVTETETVIKDVVKRTTKKKRFVPPTLDQVKEYCKERQSKIDPETFFHTYESSNWIKANGLPVQNWKSTVVTWEKKERPQFNSAPVKAAPRNEEPIKREKPDPKQQEEVSKLISQTVKSMGGK